MYRLVILFFLGKIERLFSIFCGKVGFIYRCDICFEVFVGFRSLGKKGVLGCREGSF